MRRVIKGLFFILFFLLVAVSLSFAVLAVNDNTPLPNSATCKDSDGGVYSLISGNVSIIVNTTSVFNDIVTLTSDLYIRDVLSF